MGGTIVLLKSSLWPRPLTRGLDKNGVHPEGEYGLSERLEEAGEHTTDHVHIRHLVHARVPLASQNTFLQLLDGLVGPRNKSFGV